MRYCEPSTITHLGRRHAAFGFTLIELLVVVAIIVILIALLIPALDRAMYQAEMVVCAARLKSIGTSASVYALDFQRSYPHREGVGGHWGNDWINSGLIDERPLMRGYFAINAQFNDPFCETVDFDGAPARSQVEVPVALWFGFAFSGDRGMKRLGDALAFTGETRTDTFDVLASDFDWIITGDGVWNAHPDADGFLASEWGYDRDFIIGRYTYSRWQRRGAGVERGAVDQNFVHDDASVTRLDAVEYNDAAIDTRVASVPLFSSRTGWNGTAGFYTQLPLR